MVLICSELALRKTCKMPAAKRRKNTVIFYDDFIRSINWLSISLILAIYVIMSPSPFVDKFGVEVNSGKNSEVISQIA